MIRTEDAIHNMAAMMDDILDAEAALIEPEITVEGGKQLLDLPDDCLIDICRYLSLDDLSSIALTCTRLQAIARQVFVLKPANKRVYVKHLLQSFGPNALEKVKRFFQSFGDLLLEVNLDLTNEHGAPTGNSTSMTEQIFHLITIHCCDGALEAFLGCRVSLKSPHKIEMIRLFSRLKKFELTECTMVADALSASQECQELLLQMQASGDISNFTFSKLETFAITNYGFSYTMSPNHNENCGKFLQRHTQLKVLDLDVSDETEFNMDVIDQLKGLKTLHLRCFGGCLSLSRCANFKDLKRLYVYSISTDATKFLLESAAAASLEYMTLHSPDINNDFFVGLSRFKSLRVLKLLDCDDLDVTKMLELDFDELTEFAQMQSGGVNMDGLVEMVEKFQKLESIILIDTDHEIDSEHYDRLVKICRKEDKKLTITMEADRDGGPTTLSDEINYNPNVVQVIFK